MKILVACEYSGIVRDSFTELGHDVTSCDLLPTETPGKHYQGDVRDIIDRGWDMMIAHPPCTFLSNSGVRWLWEESGGSLTERAERRWGYMEDGARFFHSLLNADIPKVVVENPIMHKYALEIVGEKASQTVHPWQHGHTQTKATNLWVKGVPLLAETNNVKAEMMKLSYAERSAIHYASPGKDRWKKRSVTFVGIAKAMAQQWG